MKNILVLALLLTSSASFATENSGTLYVDGTQCGGGGNYRQYILEETGNENMVTLTSWCQEPSAWFRTGAQTTLFFSCDESGATCKSIAKYSHGCSKATLTRISPKHLNFRACNGGNRVLTSDMVD